MAFGILKADTLTHSTEGSVNTKFAVSGSAKAWVNFNGTSTLAERKSFNVSGTLDVETGISKVSFTSSMADANYVTALGGHDIAASQNFNAQHIFSNRYATSDYIVQNNNSGGTAGDWELANAVNFGELA